MNRTVSTRKFLGASMVEFLIVVPLLLLLGLGVVQVGLIFHSKSALNFALQEAARSGAVNHASADDVRNGLLRGLMPFMGGGTSPEELAQTLATAGQEFALGTSQGWIRVQQLSPTPESFEDWEENAIDEAGNAVREIPNANLAVLRCTRAPNGGSAGVRQSSACGAGGERIGEQSQQTLSDANLLKLEMTYGVKLVVPFVNRIVGGALAMANGCMAPERQQVGALNLGTPRTGNPDAIACAAYNARDAEGNPEPRIPINMSITVRMQSTARRADSAGWFTVASRNRDANTDGVQLGNGEVAAASSFAPIPVAQLNPNGVTYGSDRYAGTSDGSVYFGANSNWRSGLTPGGGGNGSGGGTGGGAGPPDEELCTRDNAAPPSESEGSSGVLGSVWNALTGLAGTAYQFVRGFWDGIKQQLGDIVDMITDPVATAEGIYQLALAFIEDPRGTAVEIGRALGRDIQRLVQCGAYDRGQVLGNYVSPAVMLKIATKLARFGRAGLRRAVDETREELEIECNSSFGAGTLVLTDAGPVPIEQLVAGARVRSRSDRSYFDSVESISQTVSRDVGTHYWIKTERSELLVTEEHLFWAQGTGWSPIKEIPLGTPIAAEHGDTLLLVKEKIHSPLDVYNFSVENTKTYFVGDEGVWTHNCDIKVWNPWGTRLPREGSNGNWRGQRGNSAWVPQPGSSAHRATGGRPIPYVRGYPDFSQFAYRATPRGPRAIVDIPNMRGVDGPDFAAADAAYRELIGDPNWRRPRGYSWHHHQNCRTMVLVPTAVNSVPHTGGASNVRNGTC